VSACRRDGFAMVEQHAELIALAAQWEQSEQADRLARARLCFYTTRGGARSISNCKRSRRL
jgi:hypothetical protein